MDRYVDAALKYARKSMSHHYRHGAVCVVGGRVVSGGYNYVTSPHCVKVEEYVCWVYYELSRWGCSDSQVASRDKYEEGKVVRGSSGNEDV